LTKPWSPCPQVPSSSSKSTKRPVSGPSILRKKTWEDKSTSSRAILESRLSPMTSSISILSTRRHLCPTWKTSCTTPCNAHKWCMEQE
jgi:hypothetical protein